MTDAELSSAEHRIRERDRKVDMLGIYGGVFALSFGFWILNPWLDAVGTIEFFRYLPLVPEQILGGVAMFAGLVSVASLRFELPRFIRILVRSVIFFLWVFCAAVFWLERLASLLVPLFGGLVAMELHSLFRAWGVWQCLTQRK